MLERGGGKIVFVASLLSFQGGVNVPGYAACKGGIGQLTKALANEWAPRASTSTPSPPGTSPPTTQRPSRDRRSAKSSQRIPPAAGAKRRTRGCGAVPRIGCGRLCSRCGSARRRRMARAMTERASTMPAVLGRRIIPVVVLEEAETAVPVGEGTGGGWVACGRGHLPDSDCRGVGIRLDRHVRTDVVVGAGTVVRSEQVDEAVEAGALFIVTPGLSAERDRALPRARSTGDPRGGDGDRGDRCSRPGPRSAQALSGRGGRWRCSPARAPWAVSRRAFRSDRRHQRGECRVLSRAAVPYLRSAEAGWWHQS